jgi:Integrase core domain
VEERIAFGSDPPFRPGIAVHGALLRPEAPGGGHVRFDGKGCSALDNAMAESFVSTPKAEMGACVFADREAAKIAIFDYIEDFYNPLRRHSSIGYMSPADYERVIIKEVEAAYSEKMSIKLL